MVRMERKLLQYATSCSPRRAADYERVSWFDFVGGDAYSPLVRKYLESSSQALGALLASRSDARTYGNTVVQLLLDQFVIGEHADSTLAGPTSEMWFDHWRTYLEREGVLFRRGRLTGFRAVANGHLPVISDEDPADPPWQTPASNDDYFVLALSVQEMRALVDQWPGAPGALPPDLRAFFDFLPAGWQAELAKAQPGGPLKHLSGVQFFFGEELHFVDGHVLYPDSTWGLTSISQTPHWYRYRGRWDGYRTSLSVDIGDWATADTDTGKAAWNCTADEIARTVWKQISTALADRFKGPRDTQMPPVPDYYHLDREIEFGSRAGGIFPVDDRGPFLVNEVSMFDRRPGVPGSYRLWGGPPNDDRWVLAGNYMRTFTRLTTMEARNESARHAVNAVLRATTRPAPYVGDRCPVFDPEENEPPDLRWLRDLDKYLFDNNAPHWLDIEGAGEVLEQLLPSSNTALQELLGAIT
jgi:hypothetical protein